ncbi:lysoplasmalogenase family protein [Algibacter sp. L4_22]|uniref:lysoplasmalogenase family protein n=2 Tax=unclassified Algibacter TaxID=2615009 RepID=UPI00201B5C56
MLFFAAVLMDDLVKQSLDETFYRYITKSLAIGLLLVYYIVNKQENVPKFKSNAVIVALVLFIIGGCFGVVMKNNFTFFILSFVFFVGGKAFYCLRLAKNHDFNFNRIIPFFLFFSLFMYFLVDEIYDKLGDQLLIIVAYFSISVILMAFAFMRKEFVCYKSYILVFSGLFLFVISESLLAVRLYGSNFTLNGTLVVVLYELGQYLFVIGILREVLIKPKETVEII